MKFTQAERLPDDGAVEVARDGSEHFIIRVGSGDDSAQIRLSAFNAARVFGMLSLFLGIKLSAAVGRAIKL